MKRGLLVVVFFGCGCATLSPEGSRVSVYTAKPNAAPRDRSMPEGYRRLAVKPAVSMSASPITDCPPTEGAWYEVVIESYECTPEALRTLNAPRVPAAPPAS